MAFGIDDLGGLAGIGGDLGLGTVGDLGGSFSGLSSIPSAQMDWTFGPGGGIGNLAGGELTGDLAGATISGSGGLGTGTGPISGPLSGGGMNLNQGGGGGGGSWLDYIKPAAAGIGALSMAGQIPLGILAQNVARQGQKGLQSAVQTEQAAAAPAIAAENALLPAGTQALLGGQLPPELQQSVDTQVEQWKAAQLQNLANAGVGAKEAQAMIAQQEAQLRNQLTLQAAQSLMEGGTTATQIGSYAGGQAGQLGQQEMSIAGNAVTNANRAMYGLLGMGYGYG